MRQLACETRTGFSYRRTGDQVTIRTEQPVDIPAIRLVNRHGMGYLAVDLSRGRVVDGSLLRRFVFVEACESCGSVFGRNVPLVADFTPRCESCGKPLSLTAWNDLRASARAVTAEAAA